MDSQYDSFNFDDRSGAYKYVHDAPTISNEDTSANMRDDDPQYASEYWRLDADARRCFFELCPDAQGETVALSDVKDLCRRMQRPLRDDSEYYELLQLLDPTNAMLVQRSTFVDWLLADLHHERALAYERLHVGVDSVVPEAEPLWEEVVVPSASTSLDAFAPPQSTVFYTNVVTGESTWSLPSFVQCLWRHLAALELQRASAIIDPIAALLSDDALVVPASDSSNDAMLATLHTLFLKYDDDSSNTLDAAEFEDLCVAIGQPLTAGSDSDNATPLLRTLMRDVDPFSAHDVVSWDALRYYWITHAPFQRRTRLVLNQAKTFDDASAAAVAQAWDRVDALNDQHAAVVFRNAETRVERWCHPEIEKRLVALVLQLVPSATIDWPKKIAVFFQVQSELDATDASSHSSSDNSSQQTPTARSWSLAQCARVLLQLEHPMAHKSHLVAALQHIQSRYSASGTSSTIVTGLEEATVTAWCLASVHLVEQSGWTHVVERPTNQSYYYHEVSGATRWDPPAIATRMTTLFANAKGALTTAIDSSDERIARIFRQYDVDDSGSISFDEFRQFYHTLVLGTGSSSHSTQSVDDQTIAQLFAVLDTGGDDSVSLEEFTIWWRTKLQLDVDETEDQSTHKRFAHRRDVCRSFLENANAMRVRPVLRRSEEDSSSANAMQQCFESSLLPRLVTVLGSHKLKGLAYRDALATLTLAGGSGTNAPHEVSLEVFLQWYDAFEKRASANDAVAAAAAKARAEVLAHEHRMQARALERRMHAKRKRKLAALSIPTLNDPNDDAHRYTDAARKRIERLFRSFDTNGSGSLDAFELQQLTLALGRPMDAAQVTQMLDVIDTSGDGLVSLDEFLTFWTAFQRAKSPSKAANETLAPASAAALPQKLSPTKHSSKRPSVIEASATFAVGIEQAKTRMLKLSLDDFRDALRDWRDDRADDRADKAKAAAAAESLRQQRLANVFIPTRTRRYGRHLDVTWIEPDVVACVAALIERVRCSMRPKLLPPDAAYCIQTLARGVLTRQRVQQQLTQRFRQHVDGTTQLFYYEDRASGAVVLLRPVFKTDAVSSVTPFELDDCTSKHARFAFVQRQRALDAKLRFYAHNRFAAAYPALLLAATGAGVIENNRTTSRFVATALEQRRLLFAPAAFCVFDIAQRVRERLLSSIWAPLRRQPPERGDNVLIELIALRHRRQLQQRSSDAAASLPLHFVVRDCKRFSLHVVDAIARGYSDALVAVDALGRTPLHVALRERQARRALYHTLLRGGAQLWMTQTRVGDTPLHVAIAHRVPLELLRWLLRRTCDAVALCRAVQVLNARGESPFHIAIRQCFYRTEGRQSSDTAYARSVVCAIFKCFDAALLCGVRTKRGDLPLHVALDAFQHAKQQRRERHTNISEEDAAVETCVWLMQRLIASAPSALLERRKAASNSELLPIHLVIQCGLPQAFTVELWRLTLAAMERTTTTTLTAEELQAFVLEQTMLHATQTTLLHFALRYQPHAYELVALLLESMPRALTMRRQRTDDLPLHAAVADSVATTNALPPGAWTDSVALRQDARCRVVRRLCELFPAACTALNAKRQLPLHVALTSAQRVDIVQTLLSFAQSSSSVSVATANSTMERALVLAASVARPDYAVLQALLDQHTASDATKAATATQRKLKRSRSVTPLFALSLRPDYTSKQPSGGACKAKSQSTSSRDLIVKDVSRVRRELLTTLSTAFEPMESDDRDSESRFVEMARAKLRRKHHCPSAAWEYDAILQLVDLNPLDEAVLQRALLAINTKLQALGAGATAFAKDDAARIAEVDAAVAAIALDADLAIVRRVHQVLYEFPSNARVQMLGQSVLKKLLPTAFAKAAYKARIDPYWNM